jgi:Protein of unknown function (DUF2911)
LESWLENHRRKIMKRTLLGITTLAALLVLSGTVLAQSNPRGKTEVTVKGATVTIDYGRPSLHGRTVEEMLSKLPVGQVWRLGADSSTTFTTTGDLMFGSTKVPKGTYSLWARKMSDKTWKLVFNTQHGQWGTQHNPKLDAYEVPLKESKNADSAEEVTINLAKADMGGMITIEWGNMKLDTDFE